jgi:UDP-N-acetylmuramate dehydrogenase
VVFPDGRLEEVVVSTAKMRGEIFSTTALPPGIVSPKQGCVFVHADAGCPTDDVVNYCVNQGLGGMESFAGLPGTIGGAVYMIARCYDRQMSDVLVRVEYVNGDVPVTMNIDDADWGYKKSPFQRLAGAVITGAWFQVTTLGADGRLEAQKRAEGYRRDRTEKGHFRLPSCGSAFKNDRSFGAPTGKIIDELGLRGCSVGGAQIAPWHGNIIVNTGGATAKDIMELMELVEKRVFEARGFRLEREIVLLS